MTSAPYFRNHERRLQFPWSLYHRALEQVLRSQVARFVRVPSPRVLVVGAGRDPLLPGFSAESTASFACDLDPHAVAACQAAYPTMADRIAVCPGAMELPAGPGFTEPFDIVAAKEVIEHLEDPAPWGRALCERLRIGGVLLLTTPNYGVDSSLALLERTVLEVVARRDGYSRRHIHPSKFDRRRLARLDLGGVMTLLEVRTTWNRWALSAAWRRTA